MAVYTQVNAAQIAEFLKPLNVGAYISHEGITKGVENSNFHLHTTQGRYILTLIEKRTNPADLPFIFDFMTHLNDAGISVPGIAGQGVIAGKPAALITYLNGCDVLDAALTPDHCAQVGQVLARMHLAAQSFTPIRTNPVGIDMWRTLFAQVKEKTEPDLKVLIEQTLACYNDVETLPRGAVHVDVFADNVFFDNDTLSGVIDFYFACTENFIYDVAITVNAWCFSVDGVLQKDRFEKFMSAYEAIRPLSAAEKSAFAIQRRFAALRFLLTRLYDWHFTPAGADVVKKDYREYVRKLTADCEWAAICA